MLVRLLFASRTTQAATNDTVRAICASARQHNAQHGITGVLVHGNGIFMQAMEGSRQAVSDLYAAILRDERHQQVVLLHHEEITERRFGGWTLGVVDTRHINPSLLLKYGEDAALNPYAVSGRVSMALLDELIATASVLAHP